FIAEVRAGRYAESAHEAGAEVGDEIAVKVLTENHVKARRILHEAHARSVDDHFVVDELVAERLFVLLSGAANEQPIGQLHDVGLVQAGDFLAAAAAGVIECETSDTPAGDFGGDLE